MSAKLYLYQYKCFKAKQKMLSKKIFPGDMLQDLIRLK